MYLYEYFINPYYEGHDMFSPSYAKKNALATEIRTKMIYRFDGGEKNAT